MDRIEYVDQELAQMNRVTFHGAIVATFQQRRGLRFTSSFDNSHQAPPPMTCRNQHKGIKASANVKETTGGTVTPTLDREF